MGPTPVQSGSPTSCGWETVEFTLRGALDFHPVNMEDCGRCKKSTYMVPAWTKDQEHPVTQQGKFMLIFQHISYLLDL